MSKSKLHSLYQEIPAGYYDRVIQSDTSQGHWHRQKFNRVCNIVLGHKPRNLIDFGCGPGCFLRILHDRDKKIGLIGCDLAIDQVRYAQSVNDRIDYLCCDAYRLPIDMGSIAAATSIEMIEHIPPDEVSQFFAQVFSTLESGGIFVVTTPNYRSGWPLLELIVSLVTQQNYLKQHINRYHNKRLEIELTQAGFEVMAVTSYMYLEPFFSQRWMPKIIRRGILRIDSILKRLNIPGFLLLGIAKVP